MQKRHWNGIAVHVALTDPRHDNRNVEVGLTRDGASRLALSLKRLKNTTMALPVEMEELITALDYVLVGDPASVNTYKAMQAAREQKSYPDSPSDGDFAREDHCPRCGLHALAGNPQNCWHEFHG